MRRGIVTLTFDDGYEETYQNAVPLLDKHNFPGVFALPLDMPGTRPWRDWLNVKDRGHEIASHTVSHPDLTTLSPHELDRELRQSQQTLDASTLVYPGGAFSDAVIKEASRHYTAARTVKRGFETLPPKDPMRLSSINWTRKNFSVAKANLFAFWAYLANRWLIETYHIVAENEVDLPHSVKAADLDRHLKFVAKLPLHVKTIAQVIDHHHHQERGR